MYELPHYIVLENECSILKKCHVPKTIINSFAIEVLLALASATTTVCRVNSLTPQAIDQGLFPVPAQSSRIFTGCLMDKRGMN
jgi:hypothetical protein